MFFCKEEVWDSCTPRLVIICSSSISLLFNQNMLFDDKLVHENAQNFQTIHACYYIQQTTGENCVEISFIELWIESSISR